MAITLRHKEGLRTIDEPVTIGEEYRFNDTVAVSDELERILPWIAYIPTDKDTVEKRVYNLNVTPGEDRKPGEPLVRTYYRREINRANFGDLKSNLWQELLHSRRHLHWKKD